MANRSKKLTLFIGASSLFLHLFSMKIEATPHIVTLSPLATELLFELGRGGAIVSGFSSPNIPKSHHLRPPGEWFAPSLEAIVRAHADWVVTNTGVLSEHLLKGLGILGVKVFVLRINDWRDIFSESRRLLQTIFGSEIPESLTRLEQCLSNQLHSKAKFRFLALVWGEPPILFGRNTFFSKLLEAMGGIALLPASLPIEYPQVSKEWLMSQKPDRVFLFDEFLTARNSQWVKREFWPNSDVPLEIVPSRYFGRSTVATLHHLDRLSVYKGEICAQK